MHGAIHGRDLCNVLGVKAIEMKYAVALTTVGELMTKAVRRIDRAPILDFPSPTIRIRVPH